MIAIRNAIATRLAAHAGLAALVAARIYPQQVAAGTLLPYVQWRLLTNRPAQAHDGRHPGDRYTLEVVAVAMGYAEAVSIAAQAEAALDHHKGTLIAACIKDQEIDQDALVPEGSDNPVVQIVQTFVVYTAAA